MYKNPGALKKRPQFLIVSILVLMELCIKTYPRYDFENEAGSFNPCFNGTMYKNSAELNILHGATSFNPCFNGTMYKNGFGFWILPVLICVSILVLMELCIKTFSCAGFYARRIGFQSLF